MPRGKSKNTLRKKHKIKKHQHKAKKATRKGRGYEHECLFPTPETRGNNGNDSCSLIDLNDTYGLTELEDLGIEGNKQCNMFYYLDNGKFYRCRNSNKKGTRCNKRGAYGSGKIKCSSAAIEKIKAEEPALLNELNELMTRSSIPSSSRISPSSVRLSDFPSAPSVPVFPSVPSQPVLPSVPRTSIGKQPIRTSQTRVSSVRPSVTTKRTLKLSDPIAVQNAITKLNKVLAQYQSLNANLLVRKQKHLENATKPGLTRVVKLQIVRMVRDLNKQTETNNKIISNITDRRDKLQRLLSLTN